MSLASWLVRLAAVCGMAVLLTTASAADEAKTIRIGIIGADSSHAMAFTSIINAPNKPETAGAEVVAFFVGGSPDIPASRDRIEKFTADLNAKGLKQVDSIEALLEEVDAVIINSVDGRKHLEQARPVIAAGKPLFIDKPLAANVADAAEIFRLAQEQGVSCFSASTLRFCDEVLAATAPDAPAGKIVGCVAYSPCSIDPTHPDLFWYGIHGVETLFAAMGPGCVQVQRTQVDGADVATGVWKDGRTATFRGVRAGKAGYGLLLFGEKEIRFVPIAPNYTRMVHEIVKSFRTGEPPLAADETLEIMAFMEAAERSKAQDGAAVTLESVMPAADR